MVCLADFSMWNLTELVEEFCKTLIKCVNREDIKFVLVPVSTKKCVEVPFISMGEVSRFMLPA